MKIQPHGHLGEVPGSALPIEAKALHRGADAVLLVRQHAHPQEVPDAAKQEVTGSSVIDERPLSDFLAEIGGAEGEIVIPLASQAFGERARFHHAGLELADLDALFDGGLDQILAERPITGFVSLFVWVEKTGPVPM